MSLTAQQDPIYLPANSELDVQLWRMTDGLKRKVWFEWAAESYLSASSLIFFNPTTQSPSNLHPRSHSPFDNRPRSVSNNIGNQSPMVDAFASAPSPRMGQSADRRDSGRMQNIAEESTETSGNSARIKIGASKLHNGGGKHSYVGL